MGYFLWFGIVVVAFIWMHYFTALSGKHKAMISGGLVLVIGNAILYNVMNDLESKHVAAIELKFNNGEILQCNGTKIDNQTFTYSVGTQSFVGNKGSSVAQQIISATECQ